MNFTTYVKELLKTQTQKYGVKKIGFIEGWSKRMILAAQQLKDQNIIEPIMLFPDQESFHRSQLDSQLKSIIIDQEKELQVELTNYYLNKRKGKATISDAQKLLATTPYFASAMVALQKLDGAIGGVHFSSSDILRSAFRTIGPKKGTKTISSVMIMHKEDKSYLWSDISVNVDPTEQQLVEIAENTCTFADSLHLDKRVAFLSFSTSCRAVLPQSLKIKNATDQFKTKFQYDCIGEVQFDAAYDQKVREIKYKNDKSFFQKPTIFVFPDLNAGNIGYKIAQRMGGWGAIGPILTGIAKPVNDLSRGASLDDVINTAVLTALQTFDL